LTFSNLLSEQEISEMANISGFQILSLKYISTDGGGETPYPLDYERLAKLESQIAELERRYNNITDFVLIKGFVAAEIFVPMGNEISKNSNFLLIDVGPVEFLQLYPDAIIIPGRSLFYRYNKTIVAKDTASPKITNVEVTPWVVNSQGKISIKANVTDNVVVDKVNVTIGEVKAELKDIDGDGIFINDAITPPVLEGNYTVNITAYDLAGNSAYNDSVAVVVDNTPPMIDITAPANNSYIASKEIVVSWNASDNFDIARYELSLDEFPLGNTTETTKTLMNLSEGLHKVEVKAFDLANNSASDFVSFTIDTIPPEISVAGVVNGSYYNTDVSADISIYDANLKVTYILLDGMPYESGATISAEGVHLLEVHAEDKAGNNASKVLTFVIDKTPPVVNITTPVNGSYVRRAVEITGLAADVNLDMVSLSIDGIEVASALPYSWSTANYSDGVHAIELKAVDKANNTASTSISVIVDNTPPQITIASPLTQNYSYTRNITIDFNVTDATSGVSSFKAYLDDTEVTSGLVIDLFNFTLGEHALTVEASDNAGNDATKTVLFTVIDDIPPVSSDNADKEWHNSDIAVTITALDEKSSVKEIRYAVNEGQEIVVNGSTANATITYEHGNNTIKYYAVDEWGNAEVPRLVDGIKLDKTPPVVKLWLDPAKEEYYSDEPLPIKYEALDPVVQGAPSDNLIITFEIDGTVVEDPTDVANFVGTHTLTLTATDEAGNRATASLNFTTILRAEVNIDPDTLNLESEGKWITAYIEFPSRYDVMSIKIDTVTLNGTIKAENDPKYDFVSNPVPADEDGDGLAEFVVKFDRSAVEAILEPGDSVTLSIRGEFSQGIFQGYDTVKVIQNKGSDGGKKK